MNFGILRTLSIIVCLREFLGIEVTGRFGCPGKHIVMVGTCVNHSQIPCGSVTH